MKSKERLIVVQMIILGLVTLALSSNGSPDLEGQSLDKLQENTKQWVNEIQLSGTFRLGGKDYASLVTPEGNFWVEEGKFASGYKLIELDVSQSQPSALIQKGDQQAWIGIRLGMPVPVNRTISGTQLEKREGVQYVKGETEPFTGTAIANYEDNSKWETPYKDGKRHGMQIVYRNEVLFEKRSYIEGKRDGMVLSMTPRPEGRCLKPSTKTEKDRCE